MDKVKARRNNGELQKASEAMTSEGRDEAGREGLKNMAFGGPISCSFQSQEECLGLFSTYSLN